MELCKKSKRNALTLRLNMKVVDLCFFNSPKQELEPMWVLL